MKYRTGYANGQMWHPNYEKGKLMEELIYKYVILDSDISDKSSMSALMFYF